LADDGKPSDTQARKARANALRASIEKLEKGPAAKPSPREVTDEAAAKARAKAEKQRPGG